MEERRRSKRTEMSSTLMVKRLDRGDMQEVSIDIVDVSPNGVGFLCKEVLSIGAVYESKLRIWTQEVLHAFLRICLLYTSPSPRDGLLSRMPSSA